MTKFWTVIGGRKFVALLLGTGCLLAGRLESWHWTILAGTYIGLNVIQDWIFKNKGKE